MVEWPHGVEGVGGADGSGGEDGPGFGGGGIGVTDGDADTAAGGVGGEFGSTGEFRSEGDEADVALGCVIEAVKKSDVGGLEVLGRMDAALEMRNEWAFEMDADGAGDAGVCGVVEELSEAGERAERRVDGGGDGGGQVTAGAVRGEEAADGVERGGCGLHDVVIGCSVDVDVEE